MTAKTKMILVGQTFSESRTMQRITALRKIGCDISVVPTTIENSGYETRPSTIARVRHRLRLPGDPARANESIIDKISDDTNVLWLDNADMVRPATLAKARQISTGLRILYFTEDDMMNSSLRTRWTERAFQHLDLWVTTKSYNQLPDELPAFGMKNILFVNNVASPDIHRPIQVNDEDAHAFGAPITFIGSFERPRARSLLRLAEANIAVRVWGNGWTHMQGKHSNLRIEGRAIYNLDYAKSISSSAMNLCFLRHNNRDLQTCRSVEIPSCGGFMIHERNAEITSIFREDKEAVYFSSDDELIDCCLKWAEKPEARTEIAKNGRDRVKELNLTHEAQVSRILTHIKSLNREQKL